LSAVAGAGIAGAAVTIIAASSGRNSSTHDDRSLMWESSRLVMRLFAFLVHGKMMTMMLQANSRRMKQG